MQVMRELIKNKSKPMQTHKKKMLIKNLRKYRKKTILMLMIRLKVLMRKTLRQKKMREQ